MLWNRTDNWIPPTSLPARISSKNDEIPLPKNQRKCLQENPASCRASSDSARAKNSAFSAVGQNPRSRPWRFKSPHNMCCLAALPYYQLGVVYVPTVTVVLSKICHPRHTSYQNLGGSIPTCRTYGFPTGGAVWAAKFLEHIWGFNFYFNSTKFHNIYQLSPCFSPRKH